MASCNNYCPTTADVIPVHIGQFKSESGRKGDVRCSRSLFAKYLNIIVINSTTSCCMRFLEAVNLI